MKTFLGYLTFAVLLALCYFEKIDAEAAKKQARAQSVGHRVPWRSPMWAGQRVTVAQLGQ